MVILFVLATFLIGLNADCIPTPIKHTETGEDLYRTVLQDLAGVVNEETTIVSQIPRDSTGYCTSFQDHDFFLQMIVIIVADLKWLIRLHIFSTTLTGTECVAVSTRFNYDLQLITAQASITISGPSCDQLTTGKGQAQYVLQRHGLTLNALLAAVNSGGSGSGTNVGIWQKRIQDIGAGIADVRTIIANNDVAGCVSANQLLSNALNAVFGAGGPFPFL